jgi:hypothetical protein
MIVDGFPEPQPQVQHAQTTAQTADKSVGHDWAQVGHGEEQGIIGPFRGPGKDDQQHAEGCAHGDEQEGASPAEPHIASLLARR